jgi:hypothetical protein
MEMGNVWVRKAVSHLWKFMAEMWEHKNDKLHNTKSDECKGMKSAAVNIEITLLYNRIGDIPMEDIRGGRYEVCIKK